MHGAGDGRSFVAAVMTIGARKEGARAVSSVRGKQILAELLAGEGEGVSLPQLLCVACVDGLPVTGAGLSLMGDGGVTDSVAATNGVAATMEALQFECGEGPCVEASRAGRPALFPELERVAARWPGFGPAAVDAGIAAIFAFPLQIGGIRLGVLDLYRDVTGGLSAAHFGEALAYADAATSIVLHLQDQMPMGELHPQLFDPTHDRVEVHQATGMVSVQAGVGLTDALLLLRARAFADDRPVLEVARDVLAKRARFAEDGRHG